MKRIAENGSMKNSFVIFAFLATHKISITELKSNMIETQTEKLNKCN